jgi:hypothetical protein
LNAELSPAGHRIDNWEIFVKRFSIKTFSVLLDQGFGRHVVLEPQQVLTKSAHTE